ncbi:hypothetical protein A0U40_10510 [[Bacillus] sp. KCTC 13219]|nr:hypothetical protein A0U40_10510 [[Bacillus] sp. KCTC 13219]
MYDKLQIETKSVEEESIVGTFDRELLMVEMKQTNLVENGLGAAYRTNSRLRRERHSLQQQQYLACDVLNEANGVSY